MSIVIRLDVPALERLIGGDSEVEVQLRKGVVEEFAKRHLTAVLKEETFAKFLQDEADIAARGLEALVKQQIGEIKRTGPEYNSRITLYLNEDVKAALTTEANRRVDECVRRAIDEAWAVREKRIVSEVHKAISEKTDRLTELLVKDLVKQRLDKIASTLNESKPG